MITYLRAFPSVWSSPSNWNEAAVSNAPGSYPSRQHQTRQRCQFLEWNRAIRGISMNPRQALKDQGERQKYEITYNLDSLFLKFTHTSFCFLLRFQILLLSWLLRSHIRHRLVFLVFWGRHLGSLGASLYQIPDDPNGRSSLSLSVLLWSCSR